MQLQFLSLSGNLPESNTQEQESSRCMRAADFPQCNEHHRVPGKSDTNAGATAVRSTYVRKYLRQVIDPSSSRRSCCPKKKHIRKMHTGAPISRNDMHRCVQQRQPASHD